MMESKLRTISAKSLEGVEIYAVAKTEELSESSVWQVAYLLPGQAKGQQEFKGTWETVRAKIVEWFGELSVEELKR